ncbi:tyrosine-type recombinase/integrase [Noviherbaspirillum agri]
MVVRGLAPGTQKAYIGAVAAIARHYHRSPDTLSIAEIEQYLHHLITERQRAGSRQPEILSRDEVARILNAARQPLHRTLLVTAYAAGLRVSEACHVRCADIDANLMMIRVVCGKGNKDRYTLLSPALLAQLRTYWKYAWPQDWLFPKRTRPHQPLDICTAQRIFPLHRPIEIRS